MKWKSGEPKFRFLEKAALFSALLNVVLWNVFPQAQASTAVPGIVQEPPPVVAHTVVTAGLPKRLKIGRIGLNVVVEEVGLAKDGSMGVPKLARDAGWYSPGPRPGEAGSAVMAGHVDWWNGAKAAFANLRKVKVGDTVEVQDHAGKTVRFAVTKIGTYDAAADATDIFYSNDGKARLNLVTCSGRWNKVAKQYSARLVVFAEEVGGLLPLPVR